MNVFSAHTKEICCPMSKTARSPAVHRGTGWHTWGNDQGARNPDNRLAGRTKVCKSYSLDFSQSASGAKCSAGSICCRAHGCESTLPQSSTPSAWPAPTPDTEVCEVQSHRALQDFTDTKEVWKEVWKCPTSICSQSVGQTKWNSQGVSGRICCSRWFQCEVSHVSECWTRKEVTLIVKDSVPDIVFVCPRLWMSLDSQAGSASLSLMASAGGFKGQEPPPSSKWPSKQWISLLRTCSLTHWRFTIRSKPGKTGSVEVNQYIQHLNTCNSVTLQLCFVCFSPRKLWTGLLCYCAYRVAWQIVRLETARKVTPF